MAHENVWMSSCDISVQNGKLFIVYYDFIGIENRCSTEKSSHDIYPHILVSHIISTYHYIYIYFL